jgi:hypothetical protein
MHFYLRHPVHGTKVAISDLEVAMDYENGWEEYDPSERAVQEETSAPSESVLVGNELKARRKRKE